MSKKAPALSEARCVLWGENGVGKSSLAIRITQGIWVEEYVRSLSPFVIRLIERPLV